MMRSDLLRHVWLALFLAAFALISGCSSSTHSDAPSYRLTFRAHPQINNAAPLKVRVLLLKSDAGFMSADFWSLQNGDSKALAGSLLNSDEFFLMPGQLNKVLTGRSSPEARYIGIVAEYQQLDGKKWRISLPLPSPDDSSFWSWSSDELQASLFLDINGIRVVDK
ncbi:type VI secretion system lipoprotein TssJ [Enterobacteriaceae bacterium BIT-l23]|jgi:type VI secretion system protein VasD|uniref:type VI secretion system lipoprotein TssJ n=1 Tax=Jejubacter sp. L23 TaxID=3092086 RepID=UPI00158551B2|nr:type VI secretion system lipoprotein TssJ [Enterobacteriaceae bacterium BIT-l23]